MEQIPFFENVKIVEKHKNFFMAHLRKLHASYTELDVNKTLALFFVVSGLDIVSDGIDSAFTQKEKEQIINWVYSLQIIPSESSGKVGGFRSSLSLGNSFSPEKGSPPVAKFDCSHLTSTHICVLILLILDDDLSRLDVKSALEGLQDLQLPNGSFKCLAYDGESDMRFCYCATALAFILNGWKYIDTEKLVSYIVSCQNYDGGFGQLRYTESHGGSTYCAIASLYMLKQAGFCEKQQIDSIFERCNYWCCKRQSDVGGFQGRPYKEPDTCYSFWIFSCLVLTGNKNFTTEKQHFDFLKTTNNSNYGGFSKYPGHRPDILHSFFGICALSLLDVKNIARLNIPLMITENNFKKIELLKLKKTIV